MTRRDLLRTGGVTAATLSLTPWCSRSLAPAEAQTTPPPTLPTVSPPDGWTFVHITDIHIKPELGAPEAVAKAFDAIRALPQKPAFVLVGGDLVFDINKVPASDADKLYDLWLQEAHKLDLPLYYTCGNHDGYGLFEAETNSVKALQNPDYGKGIWKRRLGLENSYNSFDRNGWRFVLLDSVTFGPKGDWEGALGDDQVRWIDDLLRRTPKEMPTVFLTHMPFLTVYAQATKGVTQALSSKEAVKNGNKLLEMIQGRNVPAVFQGHTHVVEECRYLNTRFITGGAICGDWWKGWRFGLYPEGFTVVNVKGRDDLSWRYVPYGWDAKEHITKVL